MHLLPEKLNGELEVFRCMLASKDCDDFQKIFKVAFDYKAAFPEVYKLFYGVQLLGASTAAYENSFSCLQRVLSKQRLSMTQKRKSGLIHLAYESDITNNINLDDFVDIFKTTHPRRMSLSLIAEYRLQKCSFVNILFIRFKYWDHIYLPSCLPSILTEKQKTLRPDM